MDIRKWFDSLNDQEKNEVFSLVNEYKSVEQLTDLRKWVAINEHQMSTRLANGLLNGLAHLDHKFFVERIVKRDFMYSRDLGLKTWNEFVELRGY